MTNAEKDAEVERLLDAGDHGGKRDCDVQCPMCGSSFYRSFATRWNTCKDECQREYDTRIMELDGGRTIHKTSELTPQRLAEFFDGTGLQVSANPGKVVLS